MAKKKGNVSAPHTETALPPVRYGPRYPQIIPTFDRRHMPFIREGKQSAEVFAKKRLQAITVDPEIREASTEELAKLKGGGKDDDASQQGSEQSTAGNAKAVRKEEGGSDLLRKGKRARKGKDPVGKSEQHVPKGSKVGKKAQAQARVKK